jgi:hypothetical protein
MNDFAKIELAQFSNVVELQGAVWNVAITRHDYI